MQTPPLPLYSNQYLTEQHDKFIKSKLIESVNAPEFLLPTLNDLVNEDDNLYFGYQAKYDETFGSFKKFNPDLDDAIKITQQFLLSGLCYAYNIDKGTFDIYTADENILKLYGNGTRGLDEANILSYNNSGFIYAKRLDVSYTNLRGTYTVKVTNPVGANKLTPGGFLYTPYLTISNLLQMIIGFLHRGRILELGITEGRAVKRRFSTMDTQLLAKYGSNANSQPIIDMRLQSKIYVPVLCAPITTMGLTAVRFQNLDYLKVLGEDELGSIPVTPADNSIEHVIRQELLHVFINRVFTESRDKGNKKPLHSLYKLYQDVGIEGISLTSSLLQYKKALRQLDERGIDYVWNHIPQAYRRYEGIAKTILTGYEPVAHLPKDLDAFRNLMAEGLYRLVYIKENGTFATIYATNNLDILTRFYGSSYIAKKEELEDRKIYLKTSLDNMGYNVSSTDMRNLLGFFGLNTLFPATMSYATILEDLRNSNFPVLGANELNSSPRTFAQGSLEEVDFDGNIIESFHYESDSPKAQGTADPRLKVRSLFHTQGAGIPLTRKIDPASIYSMARLDV